MAGLINDNTQEPDHYNTQDADRYGEQILP